MLLDRFLPHYHVNEVHGITMRASPERVYRALSEVSLADMPLARALFGVRSLPALLMGRSFRSSVRRQPLDGETFVEQAIRGGFVRLADVPGRELVLGTIGRFWQASGGVYRVASAQEFIDADPPGYAKAAINFFIYERNGLTKLRTETRILIPDPRARHTFSMYWLVVQPGSALIRRIWLGAVKIRAEKEIGD